MDEFAQLVEKIAKNVELSTACFTLSVVHDDQAAAARYRLDAHACLDAYFDCIQDSVNETVVSGGKG